MSSGACKKGAGPILVNLVHDVDLLRYLLGEPVAVQGMQSSAARGFETEDSAVVNVRFADGALASMTISDATASPWNWEATAREDPQYRPFDADAYFIGGTKGALSLPRLHQFSYDGASNWHKPLQMEIPAVDPALPHKMQLKHFVKVVRREVEPVVTPAEQRQDAHASQRHQGGRETGQLVEPVALGQTAAKPPAEPLGPSPISPSSLPREQPPARGAFCYLADDFSETGAILHLSLIRSPRNGPIYYV